MSLNIKESRIKRVLLNDGWHAVVKGTFGLDAYEYMDEKDPTHLGGESGICATGFSFREESLKSNAENPTDLESMVINGPLTSIIAVAETEK